MHASLLWLCIWEEYCLEIEVWKGLVVICVFFFLVICATKCQMFAFLMRARHWRGWMRGIRTTSDLLSAETSSAHGHLTERRYGGIWRLRCRKMCGILWRSTISIPSTTDRSLRAITSGRRTATPRSFISDRPTGAGVMRTRTAVTTGREPRGVAKGSRIAIRTETTPGKNGRELQVIYLRFIKAVTHFCLRRAVRLRGATVPQCRGATQQLCPGFNLRLRSVDHPANTQKCAAESQRGRGGEQTENICTDVRLICYWWWWPCLAHSRFLTSSFAHFHNSCISQLPAEDVRCLFQRTCSSAHQHAGNFLCVLF